MPDKAAVGDVPSVMTPRESWLTLGKETLACFERHGAFPTSRSIKGVSDETEVEPHRERRDGLLCHADARDHHADWARALGCPGRNDEPGRDNPFGWRKSALIWVVIPPIGIALVAWLTYGFKGTPRPTKRG